MPAAHAEIESSSYEDEYEEEDYSLSSDEFESSSSSPRKPPPPKVVAGRYRLGKKLGSGSYSDVHLGIDKTSGDQVAVKLEWTKAEKTNKLLNEAALYQSFKRTAGIPRVHWWGSLGEYNIMVLDILGPSLDDLFKKWKKFSVKTVAILAKQLIQRLESVHDCGILYRDIKPHNFLMGVGDKGSSRVYLVDFGLAKRWRDEKTGEHAKLNIKKGRLITGTVRYSSPNLHEGYDASRRDDLLALGYVLLHLLRGGLPWLRVSAKSKRTRNERIRRAKAQVSDAELCAGFPHEFVEYFRYCRDLEFYEKPDYARLQNLFRDMMAREGLAHDFKYDWTPRDRETSSEDTDGVKRSAKRRRIAATLSDD